ncbi:response regulator [Patescibacteria group bacterium AH-259-L05]|nr:response regulator [Patescibacteria group bacterium AH-259-L05]
MADKKHKILIAEDDIFISRAYKDGLEQAGFEVITAADGQETLEKIRTEKPRLVLLDLIMPNKNGFEVLEEVKGDEALRKVPIVILSNLGQESDIEKGKELGAIDYLVKADLSMRQVIEKIKQYVTKT